MSQANDLEAQPETAKPAEAKVETKSEAKTETKPETAPAPAV